VQPKKIGKRKKGMSRLRNVGGEGGPGQRIGAVRSVELVASVKVREWDEGFWLAQHREGAGERGIRG
jgi:hypothetical protein